MFGNKLKKGSTSVSAAFGKGLGSLGSKNPKRKAEPSPDKGAKRCALGDISNAVKKATLGGAAAGGKGSKKSGLLKNIGPEKGHLTRSKSALLKPADAKNEAENKKNNAKKVEKEVEKIEQRGRSLRSSTNANSKIPKASTSSSSSSNSTVEREIQKTVTNISNINLRSQSLESVTRVRRTTKNIKSGRRSEGEEDNSVLYTTAVDVSYVSPSTSPSSTKSSASSSTTSLSSAIEEKTQGIEVVKNAEKGLSSGVEMPDGVIDYDKECGDDPFQVGVYAADIFNYYKQREAIFPVSKYLTSLQPELTRGMRSILVDWLVEVQESFELNHETLYLAVKLVDLYLGKVQIKRDRLQLVGTTAFWIAAKFDERTAPSIDDFCYICDDAYSVGSILKMEVSMLKALNFDIGIPLSYRFLRRYARCAKLDMETLTLSRYILESGLMEYELIDVRDSVMAGGALLLALFMKNSSSSSPSPSSSLWTPTLVYYSGLEVGDIWDLGNRLLEGLRSPPAQVKTIRAKYSHKIFFEVAKIPLPDELKI